MFFLMLLFKSQKEIMFLYLLLDAFHTVHNPIGKPH